MATIMDMHRRVQAVRVSKDMTEGAIELTADKLADVNRGQMDLGRDANGDLIGNRKPYKFFRMESGEFYPTFKNRLNAAPGFGNPDLKLTGSFHNSIRVYVTGGRVDFRSTDSKAAELTGKYGPVLGVYYNTLLGQYLMNTLYPVSIQIFKAATGTK